MQSKNATEQLESCPFCRSDNLWLIEESEIEYNWVHCKDCGADGPCKETKEEAVKAWNRRAGR